LSFELPGGEAGVGIQNVYKSSATPERALAAAKAETGIWDAEGVTSKPKNSLEKVAPYTKKSLEKVANPQYRHHMREITKTPHK
jgi:hypothetical protein